MTTREKYAVAKSEFARFKEWSFKHGGLELDWTNDDVYDLGPSSRFIEQALYNHHDRIIRNALFLQEAHVLDLAEQVMTELQAQVDALNASGGEA
jgi:hypothetical protein